MSNDIEFFEVFNNEKGKAEFIHHRFEVREKLHLITITCRGYYQLFQMNKRSHKISFSNQNSKRRQMFIFEISVLLKLLSCNDLYNRKDVEHMMMSNDNKPLREHISRDPHPSVTMAYIYIC